MDELEAQLTEVEDKITIEQYKAQNQLKKEQVVEYLSHTIRQSPRLFIKNLIQKIVVYDDRFEIYYNYLNRMPPKTDDIGDKSIAESPPNTCSDISKDSSPERAKLNFFQFGSHFFVKFVRISDKIAHPPLFPLFPLDLPNCLFSFLLSSV